MAKRMNFSVVGLPHYTVWHLYEPSVDDIRHMEEMEAEKKAREAQEKANQEQMKKMKSQFKEVGSQWEDDRQGIAEDSAKESKDATAASKPDSADNLAKASSRPQLADED